MSPSRIETVEKCLHVDASVRENDFVYMHVCLHSCVCVGVSVYVQGPSSPTTTGI